MPGQQPPAQQTDNDRSRHFRQRFARLRASIFASDNTARIGALGCRRLRVSTQQHQLNLRTQVKLMLLGGDAEAATPQSSDPSRVIRGKDRGPQPRKPLTKVAAAIVVCLLSGGLLAWHLSRGARSSNRESASA